MSTNVVISKSPAVAVGHSQPVAGRTGDAINLSPYDKMFARSAPATVFLVFEHPIHEPAKTIESGLSRALFHYYPISGRLATTATDGLVIKCTGEGVSFVAASANCTIKEVRSELPDPSLQAELAIFYPMSSAEIRYRYSQPLMLMQVTVFSCGGFVVSVTWDHAVADGVGLAQFLQAVGELARGLPSPSVVPAGRSDALTLVPPPPFYTEFMQFMDDNLEQCQCAFLDITLPSSLISRIKHDYSVKNHGRYCSAFDAVAAVIWRCRTRATMRDPAALAVLAFAESMHVYAGAREGYYGNCVTAHPVTATCGAVAGVDVLELVEMIRRGRKRMPDRLDLDRLRVGKLTGYNFLGMSSWRGLGLDELDFGGGRPAKVMGSWGDKTCLPVCATGLPCSDDYYVVSRCVGEEHIHAFRQELEMMIQLRGSVSRL